MTTYRIIIPAYIQTITARNEKEAMNIFWERYNEAQSEDYWGYPTIKVITTETQNRKLA